MSTKTASGILCVVVISVGLDGRSSADGQSVINETQRAQTVLCTDGKAHYVALAPHETQNYVLFYGDGKRFTQVIGSPPPWVLNGLHFLDPRMFNRTANPDFRGLDMRTFSEVIFDAKENRCAVRCGDQETALRVVPTDQAKPLLKSAVFEPNTHKYAPYALARDERGNYYYVDRGASRQTERSFRLFRGTKGKMQLQKMTNVVSDSEGDVFATASGSLRLILGKSQSTWIEESKQQSLTLVPWEKNLQVIYTDLGVYTGQRLGSPCDDL